MVMAPLKIKKSYSTGNAPCSVVVPDVNNDGRIDIVVANRLDQNVGVSVFLGYGNGSFANQLT
jgi:hypothetical protein